MQKFKGCGGRWERATADEKRTAVKRDVLILCRQEGGVIKIKRAAGRFNTGGPVALECRIGKVSFRGADRAVDGYAAPAHARSRQNSETNRGIRGSHGQQSAAVGNRQIDAGSEINGRARLDGEGRSVGDGQIAGDTIRSA